MAAAKILVQVRAAPSGASDHKTYNAGTIDAPQMVKFVIAASGYFEAKVDADDVAWFAARPTMFAVGDAAAASFNKGIFNLPAKDLKARLDALIKVSPSAAALFARRALQQGLVPKVNVGEVKKALTEAQDEVAAAKVAAEKFALAAQDEGAGDGAGAGGTTITDVLGGDGDKVAALGGKKEIGNDTSAGDDGKGDKAGDKEADKAGDKTAADKKNHKAGKK